MARASTDASAGPFEFRLTGVLGDCVQTSQVSRRVIFAQLPKVNPSSPPFLFCHRVQARVPSGDCLVQNQESVRYVAQRMTPVLPRLCPPLPCSLPVRQRLLDNAETQQRRSDPGMRHHRFSPSTNRDLIPPSLCVPERLARAANVSRSEIFPPPPLPLNLIAGCSRWQY